MKRIIAFLLLSASVYGAEFGDIPANLTINANEAVRRNAGDTAFEAFTPSAGFSGLFTDLDFTSSNLTSIVTRSYNDLQDLPTLFTQSAADSLYVPLTRTVNGHALSSNVTITPTDLSLVIGTNVQAWDADLDTWATKTPYAGTVVVTTGKTFTDTNNLTLSGTDGSTLNIGTGGTLGSNAFTSTAYVPTSRSITVGPTTSDLSADRTFLANVTNDAQTKAAVVPNTAPSAGQIPVGNAGNTAYAPKTISGSGATISLASTGVITLSAIANATLSNSSITIGGASTPLGGTVTATTILDSIGSTNGNMLQRGASTWTTHSVSTILDNQLGSDQGSVAFRNATVWTAIPPGTDGQVLTTHGASVDPTWETATGGGSISATTNVLAGDGAGNAQASTTSNAAAVSTIDIGNADTTLSRLGAGSLGVEGVAVPTISSTSTLTNKNLTSGTNTFPTFNQNTIGSAATLTTARNLWGQSFDGSAAVTGSLTSVGDITGGASNMAITAGTGNSRTLTLKSTTSGGTATAFLTGNADQSTTFGGNLSGTGAWTLTGGAGNMTITAGTGNSRTMALQSTTSGGTATTFLTGNDDQTVTFASGFTAAGNSTIGANRFTCTDISINTGILSYSTGTGNLAIGGTNLLRTGQSLGTPSGGNLSVGTFTWPTGTVLQAWDTQLDSLAALSYTGNALKTIRVNAGETAFELSSAGSGTVTNTGGNLTSNAVVLGAGTVDTKVSSGIITDGASKLTLGLNTSTLGQIKMFGNTSGDATIQPAAVAGTNTIVTLPNAPSTLPIYPQQITYTGPTAARTKTYRDATDTILELGGSYTPTGTWTSMTLVTPALGTPASGVMTNVTGTADGLTAGDVTRNHAVYAAASPPTVDVGNFVIVKTGVDLKTAATTDIFTVPTGRTFVCTDAIAIVTAVTGGGAGTETFKIRDSASTNPMTTNTASGSGTPAVGMYYSQNTNAGGAPFTACTAGNKVQVQVSVSQAGSTTVTGSVFVRGYYTQ